MPLCVTFALDPDDASARCEEERVPPKSVLRLRGGRHVHVAQCHLLSAERSSSGDGGKGCRRMLKGH